MAYVVSGMRFCALRARRAREAGFFSWINLFCQDGSNEVSHAHGRGLQVRFAADPGRDPDREDRHYADIYIDEECRIHMIHFRAFNSILISQDFPNGKCPKRHYGEIIKSKTLEL